MPHRKLVEWQSENNVNSCECAGACKWPQNGGKMVAKWWQNGWEMVHSGLKMVRKWPKEIQMALQW
jgi:hypothetical protein